VNGEWRQIRIHDYDALYAIPGLYERLIYEILKCDSPATVRRLLEASLTVNGTEARDLRVLDLGAGNGIVGEELADMGVEFIVGLDIIEAAAEATERDRPGIYTDYHVVDITRLTEGEWRELAGYRFNCLTCVAALGFGDIPPEAFATAYNLIEPGGCVAFNIKAEFYDANHGSDFARLIRSMIAEKILDPRKTQRYQHRIGTNRQPIHYVAVVGSKQRDIDVRPLTEPCSSGDGSLAAGASSPPQ
jgi:2-polyprenyl-3-methyl-5-hydroxy-6-metoxy-1,4-benzoquinol methylase